MKSTFSEAELAQIENFIKNLPIKELIKLETSVKKQIAEELAQKKQEEPQVTRGFGKGSDRKRRKETIKLV